MPRLLIVNPNTSDGVTALLRERALASAPAGAMVEAVTARFGARYIAGEAAAAVAGHAVLDAFATHAARHGMPDVVLLGCFGDPGLFALQALSPVPVVGLAEASMRDAAELGRFVIVTGGARWRPMLERLARSLALDAALAGIVTVERTGAELAADADAAHALLLDACGEALAQAPDARCVLLGGAALAGMAGRLAPHLPVPVRDNVDVALTRCWQAAAAARAGLAPSVPEPGPWSGLSDPLAGWLAAPPFQEPR